ncbi:MAG: hypothetical protein ABSF54_09870 [Bryobacteraceae bacterium]|jgi:hypothetical protein
MQRRLVYGVGIVAIVAAIVLVATRGSSQPLAGDLALRSTERTIDAEGKPLMIEETTQLIRPDGSRSIARLRTRLDKRSPSGWETKEVNTVYQAQINTTFDIFPVLKMFGTTPVGSSRYQPLTPNPDCGSTLAGKSSTVIKRSSGTKFGRTVVAYGVTIDDPAAPIRFAMEVERFPDLGCLEGNETSQLWSKADNTLLSTKTIEVLSMNVVPDNPSLFAGAPATYAEAKPSEIIKKDAEIMGKDCPACAIQAGANLDARHDKLWADRNAGKK